MKSGIAAISQRYMYFVEMWLHVCHVYAVSHVGFCNEFLDLLTQPSNASAGEQTNSVLWAEHKPCTCICAAFGWKQ